MHSYGTCFKHTGRLHFAIAIIAYGLYLLLLNLPIPKPENLSPLVTLTIFGALEFAFDRWGWRLLTLIPALDVYDFSGTYDGILKPGDGGEFAAKISIKQTWSHISIDFEAGAEAKSYSASIVRDRRKNGKIELIYNYYATGARRDDGNRFDHYGTSMLSMNSNRSLVSGEYYTEQSRNSFGSLELTRATS